jgi:GTP cyclohydrolase I
MTIFKEDNVIPFNQIILLKDIEFYSTCEHHFLPFVGKAHVAYIPKDKVVGISKLARIVEVFSRRLQIQERIGNQVTESLMETLKPQGAACIIEAKHFCMTSRGVNKQNSVMVTSSLKGSFLTHDQTRQELLNLLK